MGGQVRAALVRRPPNFFLPSPSDLLPFPYARSADGRLFPSILHKLSSLPLLPTLLTNQGKKKLRSKLSTAQMFTRVEGRSYPLLYRAHKWAKGGWAYLRPSPFGIYVGLPNRDLHRPQKANKHKSKAGSLNTRARPP